MARTSKLWAPLDSGLVVWGEVQGPKASLSTRQAKLESSLVEENSKVGVSSLVGPEGPEVMVVSGGAVGGAGGKPTRRMRRLLPSPMYRAPPPKARPKPLGGRPRRAEVAGPPSPAKPQGELN